MLDHLINLLWIGIAIMAAVYWWNAMELKQLAFHRAKHRCQEYDVQILDDSIVLRKVRPRFGGAKGFRWWRSYEFEFTSTGDRRHTGTIELLGRNTLNIHLEPHKI